ncbi:MAG: hypothetical protein AB8G17_21285 [Gammaproteobacteria bacterium]
MRILHQLVTIGLLCTLLPTSNAVPIDIGDFSGNETVIDFENINPGESLMNQFAGLQITGGLFGDPFPNTTIQGNQEATNFTGISDISNPITILFDTSQSLFGALFASGTVSEGGTMLLEAFNQGSMVDSMTFMTDTILSGGNLFSSFGGFSVAEGFDMVRMSSLSGSFAFAMDDLRYEAVFSIPEPALWSLFGVGVVALLVTRRRTGHSA